MSQKLTILSSSAAALSRRCQALKCAGDVLLSVAFTLPPIAALGFGRSGGAHGGLTFRVNRQKMPGWYTARRVAETAYGFKTLIEDGSGRILGARLVGPHADEVINIFGVCHGVPPMISSTRCSRTRTPHPTSVTCFSVKG